MFTRSRGCFACILTYPRLAEVNVTRQFSDSVIDEKWFTRYRLPINYTLKWVAKDKKFQSIIKKDLIPLKSWDNFILNIYRRRVVKEPLSLISTADISELVKYYDQLTFINDIETASETMEFKITPEDEQILESAGNILFHRARVTALDEMKSLIASNHILAMTSDMRLPHEWYPYARLMKRKIIVHAGPTNSGKTHQALQRLRDANKSKGGIFCGPLRLLALEVYERLNREGTYTDLLTGQEKRFVPFATHISCTMEMVVLDREYDVAVIDEIQMISDSARGWAWTRALLGLRAREIHVCGGREAIEIVRSLVETTGDEFVLNTYDRLSTLVVENQSLQGDYSKVQRGDCIVAFSRADIFSIRNHIENHTPYKCAVIYGQLPPEVRSNQARLFNEKVLDILVASDAIGMGLNLNIRRIVFHTTRKRGGGSPEESNRSRWIDPTNLKQIAGRAGRLSSEYQNGFVTTWQEVDLPYVQAVMTWDIPYIQSAGVFPSVEQVQQFYESMVESYNNISLRDKSSNEESFNVETRKERISNMPLSSLMNRFVELSKIDHRFFLCDFEGLNLVSNWLHTIPLSIADRFIFSNCPVDSKNNHAMVILYQFAASFAMKRPVALNVRLRRSIAHDFYDFGDLCSKHNILELYLWLSVRYPKYFVERDICLEQKEHAMELIQKCLQQGRMVQDNSHANNYAKEYYAMREFDPLFLPPEEYGSIREKTKAIIDSMTSKPAIQFKNEPINLTTWKSR